MLPFRPRRTDADSRGTCPSRAAHSHRSRRGARHSAIMSVLTRRALSPARRLSLQSRRRRRRGGARRPRTHPPWSACCLAAMPRSSASHPIRPGRSSQKYLRSNVPKIRGLSSRPRKESRTARRRFTSEWVGAAIRTCQRPCLERGVYLAPDEEVVDRVARVAVPAHIPRDDDDDGVCARAEVTPRS